MSRYTKGPWEASNSIIFAVNETERDEAGNRVAVAYAGDELRAVAGLKFGDERDANAILIAASPTMLDAIDYALHMLLSLPSGIDEDADEHDTSPDDMVAHVGGLIFRRLQEAKSKAEGVK